MSSVSGIDVIAIIVNAISQRMSQDKYYKEEILSDYNFAKEFAKASINVYLL